MLPAQCTNLKNKQTTGNYEKEKTNTPTENQSDGDFSEYMEFRRNSFFYTWKNSALTQKFFQMAQYLLKCEPRTYTKHKATRPAIFILRRKVTCTFTLLTSQ